MTFSNIGPIAAPGTYLLKTLLTRPNRYMKSVSRFFFFFLDTPRTYQDVVDACNNIQSERGWRPWAIETEEERNSIFQYLVVAGE